MQIFDSYIECAQHLPKRAKEQFYTALIEYLHYGREPELKGSALAVFIAIRPTLDNSRARAEAGKAGGKVASKTQANEQANGQANEQANAKQTAKQTPSKTPSKTQANEQAKGKGNSKSNKKEKIPPKGGIKKKEADEPDAADDFEAADFEADAEFVKAALDAFNAETGQDVLTLSADTQYGLHCVRANGRSIDDVRAVVRSKLAEWGDDAKMSPYVRPSTLFGAKFEEYLASAKEREKEASVFDAYA